MKCHSCGNEIRDDARFCAICGAKQEAAPVTQPAPAVSPEPVVMEQPAPQVIPEEKMFETAPAEPLEYKYDPSISYYNQYCQQANVKPQPQSQPQTQPKYEYVPQPQPQPQAPAAQPWVQPQQPQPQTWVPPQGQPGVQYVYTYGQPTTPGGPQIVYVKAKTPGRGLGIASMVLGIIGLVYTFSGISSLNQMALMIQEMAEMGLEYTTSDFLGTLIVIGVMPLLALIFGCSARKKGYKNGVSMSGLIMGIIGLVLLLIEILVLIGNGAL